MVHVSMEVLSMLSEEQAVPEGDRQELLRAVKAKTVVGNPVAIAYLRSEMVMFRAVAKTLMDMGCVDGSLKATSKAEAIEIDCE
jgi:hypothetical protein